MKARVLLPDADIEFLDECGCNDECGDIVGVSSRSAVLHRAVRRLGGIALGRAALIWSWSLIALGLGLPLEAQEEGAGAFGETIDVQVVNLEVVVTEKGHRVTGLQPGDFIVTVDGEEVAVEFFSEVMDGRAIPRAEESAAGSFPKLTPGEVVRTSYLVFLDEYFSEPAHRDRLIDELIEQLPLLEFEDRMAIVAYDGERLEVLSPWSESLASLTQVLEQAKEREAYGLQRRDETRSFDFARATIERDEALLEDGRTAGGDGSLDPPAIDERHEIGRITDQVKRAVLAASTALRSFAGAPGRRVLMLASGGWPNSPALWITGDRAATSQEDDLLWGEELYGPLIETANRLSYSIYSVDVPGSFSLGGTSGAGTAGIDGPRGLLSASALAELARRQQRLLIDRNQEEDAALEFIARRTGGLSLVNAASRKAFERIVGDTRTYYWIGFTPNWQGGDTEHEIVVKARKPGLDVRSRQSYSDLSRQTEVSMMAEGALLLGSPPSATPLVATFGTPEPAGRGKVMLPLEIEIPLAEVTFLPVQGGLGAEMELHLAVVDDKGNTVDIPAIPISVQGRVPPRPGQIQIFETTITMRKRKHEVVVSLHDRLSDKVISTKMEIDLRDVDSRRRKDQRE